MNFTDRVQVKLTSGKGGSGSVHFNRTRRSPRSGPDGGNGGKGGDVILSPSSQVRDLSHLKRITVYRAEDGKPGSGENKKGAASQPLCLPVPENTFCYNLKGQLLKELYKEDWLCLQGGSGGKGNTFFKTPRLQAPRKSQPGQAGKQRNLILEMKWASTATVLGFRAAGKTSFLLDLCDRWQKETLMPTIYPRRFLVKSQTFDSPVVLVDLPGLSSHTLHFLRQAERTKIILFFISLTDENPWHQYQLLEQKLKHYDQQNKTSLCDKLKLILLKGEQISNFKKRIFYNQKLPVTILPIDKDINVLKKLLNQIHKMAKKVKN